jgi:predicted nuclease with TOPRIM domain
MKESLMTWRQKLRGALPLGPAARQELHDVTVRTDELAERLDRIERIVIELGAEDARRGDAVDDVRARLDALTEQTRRSLESVLDQMEGSP